jgi:hypothetical protein
MAIAVLINQSSSFVDAGLRRDRSSECTHRVVCGLTVYRRSGRLSVCPTSGKCYGRY